MSRISKYLCVPIAMAAAFGALSVNAAKLEIHVNGFDMTYAGGVLSDATYPNPVRAGDPAQADSLTTVDFFIDEVKVASMNAAIHLDMFLDVPPSIPVTGGTASGSGSSIGSFGFDLLTGDPVSGGVALNIDTWAISYTPGSLDLVFGGGPAELFSQFLPVLGGGFDPNEPISVTFSSSNVRDVTDDGMYITGFKASGTANVTGAYVPEPSEYLMGGIGLLGLVYFGARRKLFGGAQA